MTEKGEKSRGSKDWHVQRGRAVMFHTEFWKLDMAPSMDLDFYNKGLRDQAG